jgi:hypothetical protein
MKYKLLIPISHITYHWKPNYIRPCHMLLIKTKVHDTSTLLYYDLLTNCRTSPETYTHSWPTLSALAVSLHKPNTYDFPRKVLDEFCPNMKLNFVYFPQKTEGWLPFMLDYLLKTCFPSHSISAAKIFLLTNKRQNCIKGLFRNAVRKSGFIIPYLHIGHYVFKRFRKSPYYEHMKLVG